MKKLIPLTFFAAASVLFFACSPKQAKLTTKDAANAAPENASCFVAFDLDKNLQKDFLAQKGAKEWQLACLNCDFTQLFFDKINEDLPEDLKPLLTKEFFVSAANSMLEKPEDIFFAAAFTQGKDEEADCKFVILKNSVAVQKTKEILERKKLEKIQKAGFEFFKPKTEKLIVAIKGDMLIVADDEAEAEKVFANLKTPQEKSFAKTPQFEKLAALKENPKCVFFATDAAGEADLDAAYFAMDFSVNDYSAAMKFLPKDGKFYEDENGKKMWLGLCKNKLPKNAILKNAMPNSTIALALALPSPELANAIPELGAQGQLAIAMLKKAGVKGLYLSFGEIDADAILKIQEPMQPPEGFLKFVCQDADAFFKDETMAQLLSSPLVAPLQIGGKTVYSTMANLKIAQISKGSAIVSTMADMDKMMTLANGNGETLANNKDAAALFEKLPGGNTFEMFIDAKNLQKVSAEINKNIFAPFRNGLNLSDEARQFNLSLEKLQTVCEQMIKKNACALGVKLEENEISAELFGEFEYDYELGAKLLKEAK